MKTFFKFLQRNKLYAAIEAFGLSVALGIVALLTSYAHTEYSVGRTSPACDSIYAIGNGNYMGMTHGTGKNVLDHMPVIQSWTRMLDCRHSEFSANEQFVQTDAAAVDQDFFTYMGIRLLMGDPATALQDRHAAVVSESFARRIFGTGAEAVGKTITWHKETGEDVRLRVTGVMPDMTPSDIFAPIDVMVPAVMAEDLSQEMDNFGNCQIFLRLSPGASRQQAEKELLRNFMDTWDYWKPDGSDGSFLYGATLIPVSQLYFAPIDRSSILRHGNRTTVLTLLAVALVLLLSALINYINLTVAQTGKRAREMATRQLMGESRWSIFRRYLCESLLFTSGCFALGCLLAFALRPLFDLWLSAHIVFATDAVSLLAALCLLVLLSLLTAAMPTAMILKYKPIDVVRGDFRLRSKMVVGRIFMVVQGAISMVMVSMGLCAALQMRHMMLRPAGYRTDSMMVVKTWQLGDNMHQRLFRDRLAQLPQVECVGMGGALPCAVGHDGVRRDGENLSWLRRVRVDTVGFRMLGFRIVEQYSDPLPGMGFVTQETRDRYQVSRQSPYITRPGETQGSPMPQVCGVLADYNCGTAMDDPMDDSHNFVELMPEDFKYIWMMLVKVHGDMAEAQQAVRKLYSDTSREFTGVPHETEAKYINEILNDDLTGTRNVMMLVLVFMVVSLLISALGMLAMSVYFTAQQGRAIALRRVFGYSKQAVMGWLSVRFVLLTLVSVVLGTPVSVWLMRRYLQDFHYAIAFPWLVLPVSAFIILLVAMLSILWQTWRAASANPVLTLRSNE